MMKVFSKCSVLLFGLMLFFGNNDSCHGSSSPYNMESSKEYTCDDGDKGAGDPGKNISVVSVIGFALLTSPECCAMYKFNEKILYSCILLIIRRLIFGGALGHNIYKKIGNGNFHIYTANLPSIPKFMHIGISYKINKMVYFNLIEFNLISFICCGILGQVFCDKNKDICCIFRFSSESILDKFFAFFFLLKRGCHFTTLSIDCKYFCLNIDILGLFVDTIIGRLVMKIKEIDTAEKDEWDFQVESSNGGIDASSSQEPKPETIT